MKQIESYNNICVSLDMALNHLERFENERKRLLSIMDSRKPKEIRGQAYSDMPKGGMDATSLPRLLDMIREVDHHIELQQAQIDFYTGLKKDIEESLTKLDGLQYKVFYMNKIEGKGKWRISEELNYSVSYIEKVLAEINAI